MVAFIVSAFMVALILLTLVWHGLFGEQIRRWAFDAHDEDQQRWVDKTTQVAERTEAAAYLDARSAMNEAAGQQWRNLSEWRDD